MITPRERVLMALHHEAPDRAPLVVGADLTTGMLTGAYHNLAAHLGIQVEARHLYAWPELDAVEMDEEILRRLQVDVRGVWDRLPEATYARNRERPPGVPFVDDWGVGHQSVRAGGSYPALHPLAGARAETDLAAHPWPDPADPTRYAHLHKIELDREYAHVAAPWLLAPMERACQLQGREVFLKNLVRRPDFARALLAKILEILKAQAANFLAALPVDPDLIVVGDDLGIQDGPLLSPTLYRTLLKPVHAELIAHVRAHTSAKILFHTDGDVRQLLDDLVEVGVEVLSPVEPLAMPDLAGLKRRYGARLAFCGAVDSHHLLPTARPEAVRQEVRRVAGILGAGGGYLAAANHAIMAIVPPENVIAMVEGVTARRS